MKKFLSLLLAVMMVVSLLPAQALAEMAQSAETEQIVEPVNKEPTAEPAKEQPQQEPEEVVKPQANEDGSIQFNVTSNVPNLKMTVTYKDGDAVQVPYTMEKGAEDNCYFTVEGYDTENPTIRIKKITVTIDGKTITCDYMKLDDFGVDYIQQVFGDSFKANTKRTNNIYGGGVYLCGTVNSNVDVYIDAEEKGNKVGDDITWTYDEETKTLTFTGKGEMYDEYMVNMPYYTYPVEKVVIGEGITHLGSYKLYFVSDAETEANNTTLKEIVYPSTMKTLGDCCIGNLDGLETAAIPEGVEEIPYQVFMNCNGIKELTLPSTLKSIGEAFNGLDDIEKVVIPEGITEIPSNGIYNKKKLASITLPGTITKIGYRAFAYDIAVKEITIPASVTEIGDEAFNGWTADQTITFELTEEEVAAKVTLGNKWNGSATVKYAEKVGNLKFNVTSNVEGFPVTVKWQRTDEVQVPYGMFEGVENNCYFVVSGYKKMAGYKFKQATVTINGKSIVYDGSAAIVSSQYTAAFGDDFVISSGTSTSRNKIIKASGAMNFCGTVKTDVNIYIEYEELGNKVGDDVTWSYDEATKTLTFTGKGDTWDSDANYLYSTYPVEKVVIGEGITGVGTNMLWFYTDSATKGHNTTLKDIKFPSTITRIGKNAIGYIDGMETFYIPEGITTLSDQIFYQCTGIKDVRIPTTMKELSANAYKGITFERLVIPSHITSIPANTFSGMSTLLSIELPEGLTEIARMAFKGCYKVSEIKIPTTVTTIGYNAFNGWGADQTIRFELTEEEVNAKVSLSSGWNGSATIRYKGDEVKYAGEKIKWSWDEGSKTLTFSGSGDMYDYTGKETQWHDLKPETIEFSGSITSVGAYTLALDDGSTVKTISFVNSIKSIGECALKGLTGVETVMMPTDLTSIGKEAFSGWTADQTIRFDLTKEDVKAKITLDADWFKDCNAKIRYKQNAKWAEGLSLVTVVDGVTFGVKLDLDKEVATIYGEAFDGSVSFAGAKTTGTMNGEAWGGTAKFSDNAAVTKKGTNYNAVGKLTLTSANEDDAVLNFDLAFSLTGYIRPGYSMTIGAQGSYSLVDYCNYDWMVDDTATFISTSVNNPLAKGANLSFYVYGDTTVTMSKGTVTMQWNQAKVAIDSLEYGEVVTATVHNSLIGASKEYKFVTVHGYNIRVTQAEGGKIFATLAGGRTKDAAAPGMTVYLKADPEPGMVVEQWVAEGVTKDPEITITDGDPNTASFVMPDEEVKVTAVFRPLKDGEADNGFRIKSVTLANGVATIDHSASTVKILLDKGSDITKVVPIIEIPEGATISPASGEAVDLSKTVTYTVSRNGGKHEYKFTASMNTMDKGRGTKDDPIRIENVDDLIMFRDNVNAGTSYQGLYVVQTADLDLSQFGNQWNPIGTVKNDSGYHSIPDKAFMGTYDAQGHKILNMRSVWDSTERGKAFFGSVKGATIKNIVIDSSCYLSASMYLGGVAGVGQDSTFENCVNNAEIYATAYAEGLASDYRQANSGGICGSASGCTFIKCSNAGKISCDITVSGWGYTGPGALGGICGDGGTYILCSNSGEIIGGARIGGISSRGTAIGCWNTGKVESTYRENTNPGDAINLAVVGVGGILGDGTAENCYNKGYVTGTWIGIGGIVGNGVANNCYNTGAVTSTYNGSYAAAVGTIVGYTDKTSADFKNLFYIRMGNTEAVGYDYKTTAGVYGTPITEDELRDSDVLEALMDYTSSSLQRAEWMADINGSNEGYPVLIGYSVVKSSDKKITSAKYANRDGAIDEENGTITFTVNYGTDLSNVALNIVTSKGATVSPASGERVDFSKGPVNYTVTAADGSNKTYAISFIIPESDSGLANMLIRFSGYEAGLGDTASLLGDSFKQDKYEYNVDLVDYAIFENYQGYLDSFEIVQMPANRGAVVKASLNGGNEITIANQLNISLDSSTYGEVRLQYGEKMHPGKNTILITVTNPGSTESVTYTINVNFTVHLKYFKLKDAATSIEPAFNPQVTEYTITLQDAMTELPVSYNTSFREERNMVKITHPDGTMAFTKLDGLNNPTYEGNVKITPEMTEFKVTVEAVGDSTNAKTYTFKLNRIGTYEVEFASNVENTVIRVYDKNNHKLTPDENGKYTFTRGETYSYTATAKGYVSAAGTISGPDQLTEGKFIITLEKVSGIKYTDLGAYWPTFRGNDENMAITDKKTPTASVDAELVWAEQSGNGMGGGAVSSPIIVGGYIYAYAGSNIIRVDKETGKTVARGSMVGSSSFSIVPPAYADGMIFVGLSNGRVQAFRADTLESLWVYKDERGGQPNGQIVYKDGCVYTGFWDSETGKANFVCLDASDEDPSNPTEAKYALWTYTAEGGFYWAGAYVTDKYAIIGTDDGDGGYSGDTAKLIVFNKDNGEIVSSIENIHGDIRSSIAYDKKTDKIYFTTKAGYFYSASVNWTTGEIDAASLKYIDLGGMSTSTPVVYNGRAYVGVAGTGQFVAYSGHNISVIDLASWTVAYRAYTKGYPQTSALVSGAYEGADGYTYVYFMENYTPGAVRYIMDKPGVTSVVGGIMENGQLCAPTIYVPGEKLAQYCICSPIVDENGTLFFKNDTSYMMAVRVKAESLEITQKPTSVTENEDGTITAEGLKAEIVLKNGEKLDVSNYVTITKGEGAEYTVTYTYGSKIAEGVKTLTASFTDENGVAAKAVEDLIAAIGKVEPTEASKAKIDAARAAYDKLTDAQKKLVKNLKVLTDAEAEYERLKKAAEDEAAAKAVDNLIAAIGKVEFTDESKGKIDAARAAYDKLTDAQKKLVSNYDVLTAAEKEYARLVKEAEDKAAAKAVDEAVAKLAPVTLNSGKAIEAARKAFDALTPAQKKLLDPKTEGKLVAAENEYKVLIKDNADEMAAKEVEDKIARLQPVTKDSGKAIKDARSSYEALTPEQKALVSKDSVAALDKAEKVYDMIIASTKPGTAVGDNTGSTSGSGVIKITANGDSKGEKNPNTGAPVMSMAPAVLVLAAAALVLKKRG